LCVAVVHTPRTPPPPAPAAAAAAAPLRARAAWPPTARRRDDQ
jgi:hypothetical protein